MSLFKEIYKSTLYIQRGNIDEMSSSIATIHQINFIVNALWN